MWAKLIFLHKKQRKMAAQKRKDNITTHFYTEIKVHIDK